MSLDTHYDYKASRQISAPEGASDRIGLFVEGAKILVPYTLQAMKEERVKTAEPIKTPDGRELSIQSKLDRELGHVSTLRFYDSIRDGSLTLTSLPRDPGFWMDQNGNPRSIEDVVFHLDGDFTKNPDVFRKLLDTTKPSSEQVHQALEKLVLDSGVPTHLVRAYDFPIDEFEAFEYQGEMIGDYITRLDQDIITAIDIKDGERKEHVALRLSSKQAVGKNEVTYQQFAVRGAQSTKLGISMQGDRRVSEYVQSTRDARVVANLAFRAEEIYHRLNDPERAIPNAP